MASSIVKRLLTFLLVFIASTAHARDESGRLADILLPNTAQPAIVAPGDPLRIESHTRGPFFIESAAGRFSLALVSESPWRGHVQLTLAVPDAAVPGVYTLVDGENGDRVHRAVFIREKNDGPLRVAVLSSLHVGDPASRDTELYRLTATLNRAAPDLILIVGDLTHSGTPDEFRVALDVLNDCQAPTAVAPGDADDRLGLAAAFLGPVPAVITVGQDALLLCPPPGDRSLASAARLHAERRRVRAARWTIALAAAFPDDDMRTNLTLLADDPLDYIIESATNGDTPARARWSRTWIFPVRPGRAQIHWFTLGPRGLEPAAEQ